MLPHETDKGVGCTASECTGGNCNTNNFTAGGGTCSPCPDASHVLCPKDCQTAATDAGYTLGTCSSSGYQADELDTYKNADGCAGDGSNSGEICEEQQPSSKTEILSSSSCYMAKGSCATSCEDQNGACLNGSPGSKEICKQLDCGLFICRELDEGSADRCCDCSLTCSTADLEGIVIDGLGTITSASCQAGAQSKHMVQEENSAEVTLAGCSNSNFDCTGGEHSCLVEYLEFQ